MLNSEHFGVISFIVPVVISGFLHSKLEKLISDENRKVGKNPLNRIGGSMVRPKRDGDWVPITARLDPDAARRLRVAAARRGTTQGRLLDELILAHLPPADPLPAPAPRPKVVSNVLTAEGLRREMARLGLTQTELATRLAITQKAVSEWFERGRIPAQRVDAVERIIAAARLAKRKA